MEDYHFDRYLKYEELTKWLSSLAKDHADLIDVESYGKSHEGRDLWIVTVTNKSTGSHKDKPAHWVDGKLILYICAYVIFILMFLLIL